LGAMAYACITGHRPTDATDRLAGTRMMPAVEAGKGRYSEPLLRAIDRALAVMAEERPQTVEEWRGMLSGAVDARPMRAPVPLVEIERGVSSPSGPSTPAAPQRSWLRVAAYAVGVIVIAAAAIGLYELVRAWSG
jgi:hypothetical protein